MSWISWFVSDSNRIVATATFLVAVAAIAILNCLGEPPSVNCEPMFPS